MIKMWFVLLLSLMSLSIVHERIEVILFVHAYDCASCQESYASFCRELFKGENVSIEIAIDFSRRREYSVYLRRHGGNTMYRMADKKFKSTYKDLIRGDVLIVKNGLEIGRTNIYNTSWRDRLVRIVESARSEK